MTKQINIYQYIANKNAQSAHSKYRYDQRYHPITRF